MVIIWRNQMVHVTAISVWLQANYESKSLNRDFVYQIMRVRLGYDVI